MISGLKSKWQTTFFQDPSEICTLEHVFFLRLHVGFNAVSVHRDSLNVGRRFFLVFAIILKQPLDLAPSSLEYLLRIFTSRNTRDLEVQVRINIRKSESSLLRAGDYEIGLSHIFLVSRCSRCLRLNKFSKKYSTCIFFVFIDNGQCWSGENYPQK